MPLFRAGSCDGYIEINEPWRNVLFRSSSFPGYPKSDGDLFGNWLRFTGIGGDTVVPTCYTGPIGGAQYPIHVPFTYPTTENQTVTGTAYGDVGSCELYSISMRVILCPGGFYIYNATNYPYANMGYVTCEEIILIITLLLIALKMTYFDPNAIIIICVLSLCRSLSVCPRLLWASCSVWNGWRLCLRHWIWDAPSHTAHGRVIWLHWYVLHARPW